MKYQPFKRYLDERDRFHCKFISECPFYRAGAIFDYSCNTRSCPEYAKCKACEHYIISDFECSQCGYFIQFLIVKHFPLHIFIEVDFFMNDKRFVFECCEVKHCPNTTLDIDGTPYCDNPSCQHIGDCDWCDLYLSSTSWCDICMYKSDCDH